MEQVYQIGKARMLSRQDMDPDYVDYEKSGAECTFKPKISKSSRQLSGRRNMSTEERPWMGTREIDRG